ncbi:MAG: glycosyltransferase family 2 protein [Lachnospiraceae bacterium]|nr:glycosyltransferase family 2 protein [Lachnospiraceae bacterium]
MGKEWAELEEESKMVRDPLVTVIVPVYKVEKYLSRCVESIFAQKYGNLEIILVDDGSPDSCGSICEEYRRKDRRVRVIHKENGGLSDARNAALDAMRGELVTFIDSDDFVSEYYISNLVTAMLENDADLSMSWFENVLEGEEPKNRGTETAEGVQICTRLECLEKMLYQDGVETTAWGKLYKREQFAHWRYPVGKLYEDILVTYHIIDSCKKIAVIPNVDYYYVQRRDSIQYEPFREAKLDAVIHMKELEALVAEKYPELRAAACCRYFSITCNILFQIKDISRFQEAFSFLWEEIRKNRKYVILNKKGRKKARAAAVVSYLGYAVMRQAYSRTQARAWRMRWDD